MRVEHLRTAQRRNVIAQRLKPTACRLTTVDERHERALDLRFVCGWLLI